MAFEMVTNRQVIFGEGKLTELVNQLKWYGKKKVMLVTYGQHHEGYKTVSGLLEEAGIGYYAYPISGGEPDLHVIDHGRDIFLEEGCDCTVYYTSYSDGSYDITSVDIYGILNAHKAEYPIYEPEYEIIKPEAELKFDFDKWDGKFALYDFDIDAAYNAFF